jgi:dTDP-D-glucose 4,6-dehydratase
MKQTSYIEMNNIDLVRLQCRMLDEKVESGKLKAEMRKGVSFADQITFFTGCPGHDLRYAIDASKIEKRAHLGTQTRLRKRLPRIGRVASSQSKLAERDCN